MSDSERQRLEEALLEKDRLLHERDAKIAELEKQLDRLTKIVDAFKRGHRVRKGQKLAQKKPSPPTAPQKRPGRKKGHTGAGRAAPTANEEQRVACPPPTSCPFCGGPVEPVARAKGEQKVEELVPARTKVVVYERPFVRCQTCQIESIAKLPDGLGESPKLGLTAQAKIIEAKTELRLTLGQTRKLMRSYGLRVSRGGLQQIQHRAAKVLSPALQEIRSEIQKSPVAWADETSWKVGGQSGYFWLVMTEGVVLFEHDRSRGQEVIQRLLRGFFGLLHSDFYAVYWTLKDVRHAPCWAHLVREARQLHERERRARPTRFFGELSRIYGAACEAKRSPQTAEAAVEKLSDELAALASDAVLGTHAEVLRLQKRIKKHGKELLGFVSEARGEGTNNRAEREAVRVALMRHVSFGSSSERGALTLGSLLSVARTLERLSLPFEEYFREARKAFYRQAEFPRLLPAIPSPSPPVRLN